MTRDADLDELLSFDPLGVAEAVTGRKYDRDRETDVIGWNLMQMSDARKSGILMERHDTLYSDDLNRYVEIVTGYGFHQVLDVPFRGHRQHKEHLYVYAHDDGLLLIFDTYQAHKVNSASVYYEVRPYDEDAFWANWVVSSGSMRNGVWVGWHDAREALVYKMDRLRDVAEFINPWPIHQDVWLCHYGDKDPEKSLSEWSDAVRSERLAMLPEHVLRMMGEK